MSKPAETPQEIEARLRREFAEISKLQADGQLVTKLSRSQKRAASSRRSQ